MLQKSWTHLKIQGARRVTCSKFHTEHPQILGVIVQNLVAWETWHLVFVHLWKYVHTLYRYVHTCKHIF